MLSKSEKELLAVVKYYNSQKRAIGRLLMKLDKEYSLAEVLSMTGYSVWDVEDFSRSLKRELKPSKRTQKVMEQGRKDLEEFENYRIAIQVDSKSTVAVRVAYDMAQAIAQEFKPGDAIWGQKEAMEKFQCVSRTVSQAFKILREKGWIEYANPKNHRFGNIVK